MGIFTGTPPTFTAGQKTGVAAALNVLRDFARSFTDPWTAATPTLAQGATVTYTGTVRYQATGKLVIMSAALAVTSSGTAGQPIQLWLPVQAAAAGSGGGSFWHFDSGVNNFAGFASIHSPTVARLIVDGSSQAHGINAGTLSTGDTLTCQLVYEAS